MRHYGYRRITTELVKAGWSVNTKHVQRIMKAQRLLRPPKQRPRPAPGLSNNSITKLPAQRVNNIWTYDFISIRLADASKLRMLSVLDEFSRFALPPLIVRIPAPAVVDHLATLSGSTAFRPGSAPTAPSSS